MSFLFVYGTLQEKFSNEYAKLLHSNSKIVGKGFLLGELYLITWYPGAVYNKKSEFKVYGTIFQLVNCKTVLQNLDEFEGIGLQFNFPNEYVRKKVIVKTEKQEELYCWVYLYNWPVDSKRFIESGVFIDNRT